MGPRGLGRAGARARRRLPGGVGTGGSRRKGPRGLFVGGRAGPRGYALVGTRLLRLRPGLGLRSRSGRLLALRHGDGGVRGLPPAARSQGGAGVPGHGRDGGPVANGDRGRPRRLLRRTSGLAGPAGLLLGHRGLLSQSSVRCRVPASRAVPTVSPGGAGIVPSLRALTGTQLSGNTRASSIPQSPRHIPRVRRPHATNPGLRLVVKASPVGERRGTPPSATAPPATSPAAGLAPEPAGRGLVAAPGAGFRGLPPPAGAEHPGPAGGLVGLGIVDKDFVEDHVVPVVAPRGGFGCHANVSRWSVVREAPNDVLVPLVRATS
jgi:hypothetical protein